MKETNKVAVEPETVAPGPPKSVVREYFESAVITMIMALFGMTFIVQAVKVPTGSMQNTILVGDHLLVNKFVYGSGGGALPFFPQREIKRGDIIVFKYPGNLYDKTGFDRDPTNIPFKTNYVKRVIGLPGDTVEMRGTTIYVNGERLPEQVLAGDYPRDARNFPDEKAPLVVPSIPPRQPDEKYSVYYGAETIEAAQKGTLRPREDMLFAVNKPTKVPDDSYFAMGDSRDHSLDGRFWGFVKRDLIIGRAMFVYWSYDESQDSGNLFTNSRWGRTGTMLR